MICSPYEISLFMYFDLSGKSRYKSRAVVVLRRICAVPQDYMWQEKADSFYETSLSVNLGNSGMNSGWL